ncbi:unnamed protein product [Cyprideis torosa]|uniref:Uncharacterized protein n=1 Tax=Cyprideis torosa TaxID=163714 RepID=A0A7R8WDQ5_9CRUS|nr:unnamed protein product [Cyprideis torosa]CAG0888790.1 unnamed protein product [Cyprideis torosa]
MHEVAGVLWGEQRALEAACRGPSRKDQKLSVSSSSLHPVTTSLRDGTHGFYSAQRVEHALKSSRVEAESRNKKFGSPRQPASFSSSSFGNEPEEPTVETIPGEETEVSLSQTIGDVEPSDDETTASVANDEEENVADLPYEETSRG